MTYSYYYVRTLYIHDMEGAANETVLIPSKFDIKLPSSPKEGNIPHATLQQAHGLLL